MRAMGAFGTDLPISRGDDVFRAGKDLDNLLGFDTGNQDRHRPREIQCRDSLLHGNRFWDREYAEDRHLGHAHLIARKIGCAYSS
jgi:hypothetical protein